LLPISVFGNGSLRLPIGAIILRIRQRFACGFLDSLAQQWVTKVEEMNAIAATDLLPEARLPNWSATVSR